MTYTNTSEVKVGDKIKRAMSYGRGSSLVLGKTYTISKIIDHKRIMVEESTSGPWHINYFETTNNKTQINDLNYDIY